MSKTKAPKEIRLTLVWRENHYPNAPQITIANFGEGYHFTSTCAPYYHVDEDGDC